MLGVNRIKRKKQKVSIGSKCRRQERYVEGWIYKRMKNNRCGNYECLFILINRLGLSGLLHSMFVFQ